MLVFVDSLVGLDEEFLDLLKLKLKCEFGFQLIIKLGNQTFYTSISTDHCFIWENEFIFTVYSLQIEKLVVKLIARNLDHNSNKFESIVLSSPCELDLSSLICESKLQIFCPLFLKQSYKTAHLKLFLSFSLINFSTKILSNCLRNSKAAEEDLLAKEKKQKQYFVDEKLDSNSKAKQIPLKLNEQLVIDNAMNENQSVNSLAAIQDNQQSKQSINITVLIKMKWPKPKKFSIEIVGIECSRFLTIFQLHSIDFYLKCVIRKKEKELQTRRSKNFKLKSRINLNEVLRFNCIRETPLSNYHLNLSLHETKAEDQCKVAEVYAQLPSLMLSSGQQLDKELILNLTPMFYLANNPFL